MGLSVLQVSVFQREDNTSYPLTSWGHQTRWLWDSSFNPTNKRQMGNSSNMCRPKPNSWDGCVSLFQLLPLESEELRRTKPAIKNPNVPCYRWLCSRDQEEHHNLWTALPDVRLPSAGENSESTVCTPFESRTIFLGMLCLKFYLTSTNIYSLLAWCLVMRTTDLALPFYISSFKWLFYQKFIATSKSQIPHYIKRPSRAKTTVLLKLIKQKIHEWLFY